MVDFNPAFANAGPKREPSPSEITNGLPCGPADQELFNWLFYATQSEIDGVISKSGLTPSNADFTQLAQAVRSQSLNYRAVGGTANALTLALDPAPASNAAMTGMPLRIKIATTNTGPATLSVSGNTASLRNANGGELVAGDLLAGVVVEAVFDGTVWRLMGHARGRLLNVRVYASAGVSTYAPTPGTDYVEVEVYGGGGGGAGVPATGAGETAAAGGGGSGAYAYRLIRSGFAGTNVTVGAGGTAGNGAIGYNQGGTGGASSFGGFVSAPGGGGGTSGGPSTTFDGYYAPGGVGGPIGVGGDVNAPGTAARPVYVVNKIGDPVPPQPGMWMGGAGCGGTGLSSLQNTAAKVGQQGGTGLVIVREYA